jgi:hypothetical protein
LPTTACDWIDDFNNVEDQPWYDPSAPEYQNGHGYGEISSEVLQSLPSRGAKGRNLGRLCSFSGQTAVLMADGAKKPISKIKIGDKVLATDPQTGERTAKEVTKVWVHDDTVVSLQIDGQTITTTEDHPFWNRTDRQWQRADQLDRGDQLLAPNSADTTVRGLRPDTRHTATAYNLTIADIRTYYVLAGNTPVLVHNTCPEVDPVAQRIADHANGEALRPDGDGTHFVRGVSEEALPYYVDGVINRKVPNVRERYLDRGRVGYWDPDKRAVVIEDGDGGTVFTPRGGESWFDNVLK